MTPTPTEKRRDQLIRNVLATAAARGMCVTLAACLDKPLRIRDRETDYPVNVRLRDVVRDDVRCD
jgi:hypothetical protein